MDKDVRRDGKAGEGRPRRSPAAALAWAIWNEEIRTDASIAGSKQARSQDWQARRKAYANQARRIIERLEEQGYSVSEKQ